MVAPPLKVARFPTVKVPPMVVLLVIAALFSVATPVVVKVERVVAPVTLRVPPIVSLLVMEALFKVAKPDVANVDRLVALVTFNVPPTSVFPVAASMVNFPPFTVTLPLAANVPPRVVVPEPTVKVFVPLTPVLPLSVTAPFPVEKVEEAPDWVKEPFVVIFPSSSTAKLAVPLDWTSSAVWLFAPRLVSLIMRAFPVPAFVKANELAKELAKLKAILFPVVVIVFPPA